MNLTQLRISRRSVTIAAVCLLGMVSLAIGAHAALNKRALDAAKAVASEKSDTSSKPSRIALVIGNGSYPDASLPLTQPINDARTLTEALRREFWLSVQHHKEIVAAVLHRREELQAVAEAERLAQRQAEFDAELSAAAQLRVIC